MGEMIKSEEFSRRKALSLLGLFAAFNLAERCKARRTGRTERREERRN
jgi:hypothetical protein